MAVDNQLAGLEAIDVQTLGPFLAGLQLRIPAAAGEVTTVLLKSEPVHPLFPGLGDVDDHLRHAEVRASPAAQPDRASPRARWQARVRLHDVAVLAERLDPARVPVSDDARQRHSTVGLGVGTGRTQ
jgi:hypothetical protein